MKKGIEAGLALVAAGLLTTGQKVYADDQTPQTNNSATTSSAKQATEAPVKNTSADAKGNFNASDSDVDQETSASGAETIRQQLQDVVTTQKQADASAKAAADLEAKQDAKQEAYDQHQAAVRADEEDYAQRAEQYNSAKDDFETAQAQTQLQTQKYNEANAQYQQKADAYNQKQANTTDDTQQLATQITIYNTQQARYEQDTQNFGSKLGEYKTALATYQQNMVQYRPETSSQSAYVALNAEYQQLIKSQVVLQVLAEGITSSKQELNSSFAQLQSQVQSVQTNVASTNQAEYEALSVQRQSLLAEANRLMAQQAGDDQNAARAEELMATYRELDEQETQIEAQNDALTAENDDIVRSFEQLDIAGMLAARDQGLADDAKSIAQDNISEQIHTWIIEHQRNSGNNNGKNTTAATKGNYSGSVKNASEAQATQTAIRYSAVTPVTLSTSPIIAPISLITPATEELTSMPFGAPVAFATDDEINTNITLPLAPATVITVPAQKPAPQVIKLLDDKTNTVVFEVTVNQDAVTLSVPSGYHLAQKQQGVAVLNDQQVQITRPASASEYAIYVEKDAVATPNNVITSDTNVSASVQKITKSAPAVSVSRSDYYDNRQIQPVTLTKSAPAISVSQANYYDNRQVPEQQITKSAPAVSVTEAVYYDNRESLTNTDDKSVQPVGQSSTLISNDNSTKQSKLITSAQSTEQNVDRKSGRREPFVKLSTENVTKRAGDVVGTDNALIKQKAFPQTGSVRAQWLPLIGISLLSGLADAMFTRKRLG